MTYIIIFLAIAWLFGVFGKFLIGITKGIENRRREKFLIEKYRREYDLLSKK